MAGTKRNATNEIPLWTRQSDIKSMQQCQLQWLLQYLFADEIPDATYFVFGDSVHNTIEAIILDELSLEEAKFHVEANIRIGIKTNGTNGWVETSRRPLDADELVTEAQRGIENWWNEVHPTSEDRHFNYEAYNWPPRVEYFSKVPKGTAGLAYPMQSQIDTVFEKGDSRAIVDWKSGATAKASPVQLWVYHWQLKNDPAADWYPEDTRFDAWFHHTNAGKYGGKIQPAGDYPGDEAIEHVIRWVEQQKQLGKIKSRRDGAFPPYPDWWCNNCRVRSKCPVYDGELNMSELLESVEWVTEPHE